MDVPIDVPHVRLVLKGSGDAAVAENDNSDKRQRRRPPPPREHSRPISRPHTRSCDRHRHSRRREVDDRLSTIAMHGDCALQPCGEKSAPLALRMRFASSAGFAICMTALGVHMIHGASSGGGPAALVRPILSAIACFVATCARLLCVTSRMKLMFRK